MSYDSQGVKARFQAAVDRLAARLEEDYYVLAAVLYGSVARGEPWERSDIDLIIVLRDGQERANRNIWLVEDDLNVSAELITRGSFKRGLESTLQGSMFHSIRSQFRLLFSKDETITAWLSEPASRLAATSSADVASWLRHSRAAVSVGGRESDKEVSFLSR